MKLPLLFIRPTILLFCCLMFLSGCTVYHKKLIGIDEAVRNGKKVLVTRKDERKLHLKKIELVDGKYFGTYMVKREYVKVPLETSDIKSIRLFNRGASTWGNIGLIGGPILIIAAIIIANDYGKWNDDDGIDLGL